MRVNRFDSFLQLYTCNLLFGTDYAFLFYHDALNGYSIKQFQIRDKFDKRVYFCLADHTFQQCTFSIFDKRVIHKYVFD